MSAIVRLQVTGVTPRPCGETAHAARIKFSDGTEMNDVDAIAVLKAGGALFMIPPPGAPAYEAHIASGGKPLHLQWRTCETCGEEVLFA